MPTSQRDILFSIKESTTITRDLWNRFADIAIRRHGTITAGLAALMREYVDRSAADPEQPRARGRTDAT
jgi:hypothetical protein